MPQYPQSAVTTSPKSVCAQWELNAQDPEVARAFFYIPCRSAVKSSVPACVLIMVSSPNGYQSIWWIEQFTISPLLSPILYFSQGKKNKQTKKQTLTMLIYEYSICSYKSKWRTAQQSPTAPRSPPHHEQGWLWTQPSSCCTSHLFPDFCLPVSSNLFCTNHPIPAALFRVTLEAILEAPLSAY